MATIQRIEGQWFAIKAREQIACDHPLSALFELVECKESIIIPSEVLPDLQREMKAMLNCAEEYIQVADMLLRKAKR